MSKKSRENSSKTPAAKIVLAKAKSAATKTSAAGGKAATKKSAAKTAKSPAKPAAKASKTKPVKTSKPGTSARSTTAAVTAKPKATVKPAAKQAKTSVLAEGAAAPTFRLPRNGGETVSLADYAGQKLVIFFYPRADTPGCTREAIDFTRLAPEFDAAKTSLLGVSADPTKAQESFQKKHALAMPLMSDESHAMLASYGAWGEKSMYGKVFEGVLRTTVLIGEDGRIAKIWRAVKVDGHADEVLEAARRI